MAFNVVPSPIPRLPLLNRSLFGEQPLASHATEPFHAVPAASRGVHSKLYLSKELTESVTRQISPGPVYRPPSELNPRVVDRFAV